MVIIFRDWKDLIENDHLLIKDKLIWTSDVPGLDFSGFGRARAFMYRASGGPGFSLSGFELFSGFSKV